MAYQTVFGFTEVYRGLTKGASKVQPGSSSCVHPGLYFVHQCYIVYRGHIKVSTTSHIVHPGTSSEHRGDSMNTGFAHNPQGRLEATQMSTESVHPGGLKGATAHQSAGLP
jgi:hypothetical protein